MGKKYSEAHQWVEMDAEGNAAVGITDFAQGELGDVVYIDLPERGLEVSPADVVAVVESVKTASDVRSPIGGRVVAVNESLNDEPEQVNADAEGAAWFFKIRPADVRELEGLMDRAGYADFVGS